MSEYNCRVSRVIPKSKIFTYVGPFEWDSSGLHQEGTISLPEMYLLYRRWMTGNGTCTIWALMPHKSFIFGKQLNHSSEKFVAQTLIEYYRKQT